MNLTQSIQELLYQYDCVIVPGFGGFVCSFNPASIHPVQHRFHPPSKKISFNQMLIMNDGLLAHNLAKSSGISYEKALEKITQEVYNWKRRLQNSENVELSGIGTFVHDHNGHLQFSANPSENYLRDSYGLTVFQSVPINRPEPLKVVHRATEEDQQAVLPSLTKMAKYSVAAALISVAMLTTYKLNLMPNLELGQVSMNPFKKEAPIYKAHEYRSIVLESDGKSLEEKISESNADYLSFSPSAENSLEIVVKLKNDAPAPIVTSKNNKGRFHVVGGCFGVELNAEKLVKKLKSKGYKAHIPTMLKNLHVVSYQSFETRSEAEEMLEQIKRTENAQAWLLEK